MKKIAIKWILCTLASFALLFLGLIMVFLFLEGLPLFIDYSPRDFFFGSLWYPEENPPLFGIVPVLMGSLAVTVLSSLMAVPLGVMTAAFLREIAPSMVRRIFKPLIELLAALPSVVLGLFGMMIIAPAMQKHWGVDTGLNLFTASMMLTLMTVPTICSITEDALSAVPRALREASLALGATRWETIHKVVIPAARSGIGTAIMLGMSRSIGETMVVLMVAGGANIIPLSIFDPVRPMPAVIAAEMAESAFRSSHYHALFSIAVVLFIFTLLFNITAQRIAQKHSYKG